MGTHVNGICPHCEQRPTIGHDPVTGAEWRQCGCAPYPANVKCTHWGTVREAIPADPTEAELAAWLAAQGHGPHGNDSALAAAAEADVAAEVAAKLAGPEQVCQRRAAGMEELAGEVFIDPPAYHSPQRRGPGFSKKPTARQEGESGAKRRRGKNLAG